ncbi:hypothetical protein P7K49_022615 [Saguinus oedipus]|uniref:Uncharacterized protein n=1 Tax=Saguinus oedipus TaxID=9490 RepID=A0ABQ9UK69_SAGOE|nr:hypothetical protein P7K49_022615 [Saguinus oedipus]
MAKGTKSSFLPNPPTVSCRVCGDEQKLDKHNIKCPQAAQQVRVLHRGSTAPGTVPESPERLDERSQGNSCVKISSTGAPPLNRRRRITVLLVSSDENHIIAPAPPRHALPGKLSQPEDATVYQETHLPNPQQYAPCTRKPSPQRRQAPSCTRKSSPQCRQAPSCTRKSSPQPTQVSVSQETIPSALAGTLMYQEIITSAHPSACVPGNHRLGPAQASRTPGNHRLSPAQATHSPGNHRLGPAQATHSPGNHRLSPAQATRSPENHRLGPCGLCVLGNYRLGPRCQPRPPSFPCAPWKPTCHSKSACLFWSSG